MTCSRVPRPVQRDAHPHEGTIVTDRVDDVWDEPVCATGSSRPANDMSQTVTTQEGRAYVFVAVDHCAGAFIGTHASPGASRWEALEPVRQGVTRHFGGVGPDVAKGLTLRHDHGSNDMADDFRREIGCFGILSSPAFVGRARPHPQGAAAPGAARREEELRHAQRLMAPPAPRLQDTRSDQGRTKSPNPKPPRGLGWLHEGATAPGCGTSNMPGSGGGRIGAVWIFGIVFE